MIDMQSQSDLSRSLPPKHPPPKRPLPPTPKQQHQSLHHIRVSSNRSNHHSIDQYQYQQYINAMNECSSPNVSEPQPLHHAWPFNHDYRDDPVHYRSLQEYALVSYPEHQQYHSYHAAPIRHDQHYSHALPSNAVYQLPTPVSSSADLPTWYAQHKQYRSHTMPRLDIDLATSSYISPQSVSPSISVEQPHSATSSVLPIYHHNITHQPRFDSGVPSTRHAHLVFVVPYLVSIGRFYETYPSHLARIPSPLVSERTFQSTIVRLNYQILTLIRPVAIVSDRRIMQASMIGVVLTGLFGIMTVYSVVQLKSLENNPVAVVMSVSASVALTLSIVCFVVASVLRRRRHLSQQAILELLDHVNTAKGIRSGQPDPSSSTLSKQVDGMSSIPNRVASHVSMASSTMDDQPTSSPDAFVSAFTSNQEIQQISVQRNNNPSDMTTNHNMTLSSQVHVEWKLRGNISIAATAVDRGKDTCVGQLPQIQAGVWRGRRLVYRADLPNGHALTHMPRVERSRWLSSRHAQLGSHGAVNRVVTGVNVSKTYDLVENDPTEAYLEIHVRMPAQMAHQLFPDL